MNEELSEACRREADTILAQHDWRLVESRDVFAAQVGAETVQLRARAGHQLDWAASVRRAVYAGYGAVLHGACGAQEAGRQARAYLEIWRYLYPWLRHSLRDESRAADSAQGALVKIWQRHAQCREPRSFLRWIQMVALNESKSLLRVDRGEADTETELAGDDTQDGQGPLQAGSRASADAGPRLDDAQVRARVLRAIQDCIPGSDAQRQVIVELFLNERGMQETAELLGLSVANLSVLKTRAFKSLRGCTEMIEALEDWLEFAAPAAGR
jgi:RNA polymerase sigma factor (sigma-70 family)